MISMRYHIVSLAAIFLALALGIVLGATKISSPLITGLERLQDLGVGAVTFPASGSTEDLALLLADGRDASMIVTVGMRTTLIDLLDRGRGSTASTFLVRMRVANKVVEAPAVASLYRSRISWWVVTLLILAAALAMVVALMVSDVGGSYAELVRQWWFELVDWVKGLF